MSSAEQSRGDVLGRKELQSQAKFWIDMLLRNSEFVYNQNYPSLSFLKTNVKYWKKSSGKWSPVIPRRNEFIDRFWSAEEKTNPRVEEEMSAFDLGNKLKSLGAVDTMVDYSLPDVGGEGGDKVIPGDTSEPVIYYLTDKSVQYLRDKLET